MKITNSVFKMNHTANVYLSQLPIWNSVVPLFGPTQYHTGATFPENKVHGANMGPTWLLSAPDGAHVSPMSFAFRVIFYPLRENITLHKGVKRSVLSYEVLHFEDKPYFPCFYFICIYFVSSDEIELQNCFIGPLLALNILINANFANRIHNCW